MNKIKNNHGFTLVELLIVMSILGVLATMIASGFRSSQARGRDVQRKSDLKQIASALEIYYSDYSKYPDSLPAVGEDLTDNKTVYMKTLPDDPVSSQDYYYRVVDSPLNQKFQLFAKLENSQDMDINSDITHSCGGTNTCNFAITSANTSATE